MLKVTQLVALGQGWEGLQVSLSVQDLWQGVHPIYTQGAFLVNTQNSFKWVWRLVFCGLPCEAVQPAWPSL